MLVLPPPPPPTFFYHLPHLATQISEEPLSPTSSPLFSVHDPPHRMPDPTSTAAAAGRSSTSSPPGPALPALTRPRLKKSRTIAGTDAAAEAVVAVRGLSATPASSSSSFSSPPPPPPRAFADLASDPAAGGGIGDRDWYYPSFLGAGPHASRARGGAKAALPPKPGPPPLPPRQPRTPPRSESVNHTAQSSPPEAAAAGPSAATASTRLVAEKRKLEQKVEIARTTSAGTPPQAIGKKKGRFDGSFAPLVLVVACLYSFSLAAFNQMKIADLQGEIFDLRRSCNLRLSDGNEVLQIEDDSLVSSSSYINSRTIVLYSVLLMLVIPFMLLKCLDNIPIIKPSPKNTSNKEEEAPLKKRLAYRVDVFFSVYPYAKLLALLFATVLLIAFGGLALYAVSDSSLSEALWLSWTFVADSGNHADQTGMGPRIVSVSISSGGMLVFAMMLGLVSDAISEKVDSLRKGKSEVIEMNHVLILGWSDKLGSLLKQLAIANKSLGGGVVVVLAERDKEEMEMDIAKLEFDFMGTSVICRSGSPLILADLKKVSVSKARAIIVLATDDNADQSDARALRVVLSLTGVKEGLKGHVVVEMSDLDNEPLVKLVGGDLIETVVAHDVIGRLMIQCALQPGLAQIWEDILGFENAEFYIKRWPELLGMRFEDVLISFPDAVPCGVKVAKLGGKILLNPDDDYIIEEEDEILVIAEDDDSYTPRPLPQIHPGFLPNVLSPPKFPEKILFCGWRRDIDDMIMVLEAFLAPGSQLWMFSEVPEKDREKKLIDGGLDLVGLSNITLVHREGNAVIRRHLENLPLETFDSILILADESLEDSVVHSDSRSLATLLLIRDIQSKRLPFRERELTTVRNVAFQHSSWIREMQQASNKSIIISEILDSRTRNLVSVSRISDYVLSNELVSMALAMVAEDKQINRVLEELFADEGNEMYIRSAEFYLYDQEEVCFFEIMARARQRQEIVIGYRLAADERAVINPTNKSEQRKWSLDDVFVIIAMNE